MTSLNGGFEPLPFKKDVLLLYVHLNNVICNFFTWPKPPTCTLCQVIARDQGQARVSEGLLTPKLRGGVFLKVKIAMTSLSGRGQGTR